MPFTPIDVVPARPWEYGFKFEMRTKFISITFSELTIAYAWELERFTLHINAHHLGDKPCTHKFKTDVLPPIYLSFMETECVTESIVYIWSNKDDQIANTLWWEPVSLMNKYSQAMLRNRSRKSLCRRDLCTRRASRSTGTPTNGDAIVKRWARKLRMPI